MNIEDLYSQIRSCRLCPLYKYRTNAVPGEGPIPSKIMVIGEAPGKNEDIQGRPFVGRAGKLLEEALEKVGIRREEIYITNVVKCRPPNNRKPFGFEIHICVTTYLFSQIEIVDPKVIISLGVSAAQGLGFKFNHIKEIIGIHDMQIAGKNRKVVVAYHPSFPLRFPVKFEEFVSQLSKAKEALNER